MRIYLDDNSAWPLLAKLLSKAGQDVQLPSDVGMTGKPDAVHLAHAITEKRACLTRDYDDYLALQHLIKAAQGRHAGILVVRQDNDPRNDLTPKGIVAAIRKLVAAGVPIANESLECNVRIGHKGQATAFGKRPAAAERRSVAARWTSASLDWTAAPFHWTRASSRRITASFGRRSASIQLLPAENDFPLVNGQGNWP